jgi:hypothetical protein
MDRDNVHPLIAENAQLRERITELEAGLTRLPSRRLRERAVGDMVLTELTEKVTIQLAAITRGTVFASAEACRSTADILNAVSDKAWQREQQRHLPLTAGHLPTLKAAARELSVTPRRVLQKFFEYYSHPYTQLDPDIQAIVFGRIKA